MQCRGMLDTVMKGRAQAGNQNMDVPGASALQFLIDQLGKGLARPSDRIVGIVVGYWLTAIKYNFYRIFRTTPSTIGQAIKELFQSREAGVIVHWWLLLLL